MSSPVRHPDEDQLLRYADGELAPRQARKVQAHLQACWQCRTELEELQNTVGECVRYRKNVLAEHLPQPPARWHSLESGFDEIDARLRHRSRLAVLKQTKTWLPIAAALVLACTAWYELRETPSVEAAGLLRRAVAAADRAPQAPHPVRVRSNRPSETRVLLAAAHFDSANPLSARSFADWRDQLASKHDEVITTADRLRIRTSTPVGELAVATISLRATDLHPVEERLEFRNQDWIEIEEMNVEPIAPPPAIARSNAPAVAAAPAPAAPERAKDSTDSVEFRQPAPAATVGDELQVLVALHHLGADLGDPIQVKRAGGQVLVAGVGIDPQRRQQIERALSGSPNVVLRFSDAADSPAAPERPVRSESAAGVDLAALAARIEKQAGGKANYERLSSEVLDASETMMARAFALRRLAEQFPQAAAAQMTPADRTTLHDLYHEHAAALARETAAIEQLLKPVLIPLGGRAAVADPVHSGAWQSDTEMLFRTARRAESLLAVMLGVAPGESSNLPTQVLTSLARLRASAEAYGPAGTETAEPR